MKMYVGTVKVTRGNFLSGTRVLEQYLSEDPRKICDALVKVRPEFKSVLAKHLEIGFKHWKVGSYFSESISSDRLEATMCVELAETI